MSLSPSSFPAPTPKVFALTQDLCIYGLLYCHKFRERPGLSKAKIPRAGSTSAQPCLSTAKHSLPSGSDDIPNVEIAET